MMGRKATKLEMGARARPSLSCHVMFSQACAEMFQVFCSTQQEISREQMSLSPPPALYSPVNYSLQPSSPLRCVP